MLHFKQDPFCCAVKNVGRKRHIAGSTSYRLEPNTLEKEYNAFIKRLKAVQYGHPDILTYWHREDHKNITILLKKKKWKKVARFKNSLTGHWLALYVKKI